ncbi:hypothetical protein KJ359_005187 [Pestalotiopsis sp. 9143b]|nr:hypothetical protein KJ359_005187 [Pestalotiopsis sp. 9143b]
MWYYEVTGNAAFPLIGGAIVGVGAGAVFITSGYIQVAYSNDKNKGQFIAIQNTIQAAGSIICSILPVILNRENTERAGVPAAIYATYIALMLAVALLSLITLRRPDEVKGDADVKVVALNNKSNMSELLSNLAVFKDWKLLVMLPAFLPAGSFLIYLGSTNAFENSLRARSLLSFIALVVQIPFGHILQLILDNDGWTKRRRALAGLSFVAVPLTAAWLWEIVRTRHFDRASPPTSPVDWTETRYGLTMVMFVLNWTASILWQYIVPWFIGNLDIPQDKIGHYMGVQRGFLAAGEAICFGVDAAKISFVAFASAIFAFYVVGITVLAYIGGSKLVESTERKVDVEIGEQSDCTEKARDEKGYLSTTTRNSTVSR